MLSPSDLVQLSRLRLRSVSKLTDRGQGERLAGRGGTSIDFVDYRDYAPGDDLRHVDWNAFARLQRPFLKQFRREEDRHLLLIVDASASMAFPGKLEQAKRLAAAFAVMGLHHGDRVSLWCAGSTTVQKLPPLAGRQWRDRAFAGLSAIETASGPTTIAKAISDVLIRHAGRGIAVLFSDFLGDDDHRPAMTRLRSAGLEPWAVQVLSPAELDPQVDGDQRLVDSETGETLDVSAAGGLLGLYQEYRQQVQQALEQACTGRHGRYLLATSDEPHGEVISRIRKLGWVQ